MRSLRWRSNNALNRAVPQASLAGTLLASLVVETVALGPGMWAQLLQTYSRR